MLKTKLSVVLLLTVFLFAACEARKSGSAADKGAANAEYQTAPPTGGEPELAEEKVRNADDGSGGRTGDQTVAQVSLEDADKSQTETAPEKPVERKIIRNADFQLESSAPEEAQQKITSIAESKGGFVIDSTQSMSDIRAGGRDTVVMTIRVPAEKFDEALDEIRKTSERVLSENVKGQDVTEEFIDIEARLKAKRALEAQFMEIMKRSNTVQDALNVQRELANVRTEIERIEGRKRFLENQASLSTIKVTLRTPAAIAGSSQGFFYRLTEAINTGLNGAISFVMFFVTVLIALLPFLLLVVLPIYLILRYLWRKSVRARRSNASDTRQIVREELKEE
ncbi:MAG: DUF4349 domain-containing protein [Pyrinomonadaceae bacterium]